MIKGKIERIVIKGYIKGATLYTVNYDIVYTKDEVDDMLAAKQNILGFTPPPNTRTINSKPLTSDINLNQDNIPSGSINSVFTLANLAKLNNIENQANKYVHPTTHAPSIIAQDASNRFVTDTEKSTWNGKANASHTHTKSQITDLVIPTALSQLTSSENYRTVTDTEKSTWNSKAEGSHTHTISNVTNLQSALDGKQALLVSGTNLKSINSQSLLGSGNIVIEPDTTNFYNKTETNTLLSSKSDTTHTHDNRYYTETETDTLLSGKSSTAHNHSLANLTEKSYNSLSDKPDLSSLHTHTNKTLLDGIVNNGDGSSFLANDGTYKTISGGSTDHSALSNRNIADQHVISSITGLQSALDGKQATISLTADRVAISSGAGALTISDITTTELGYLNDVSANIQTQLNGKSATSHNHNTLYESITDIETLTNLTVDGSAGNFFISSISANSSFTLSNIATAKVYYVVIKNTGGASITITLPNTADVKSVATFDIGASKTKEVSFIYDGTTRYWQVSEELT